MSQEKSLRDLLYTMKEIMNNRKVDFWLEAGTLLGAVRENRFLTWEHDLDFGAWANDMTLQIKNEIALELKKRGWNVGIDSHHINVMSKSHSRGRIWGDINFYQKQGFQAIKPARVAKNNLGQILMRLILLLQAPYHFMVKEGKPRSKYIIGLLLFRFIQVLPTRFCEVIANIINLIYIRWGSRDASWVVPIEYFQTLKEITFYGKSFKIPSDVECYLAYRYGEDWRIPRKGWKTEEHDGAVLKKEK